MNVERSVAPVQDISLAEYGAGLRNRMFSAEATVRRLLERISEDAALDAYTHVDVDGALAAARAADCNVVARNDTNPFMGVPIALKDLYAATGLPMTAGSRVDISDRIPGEGSLVRALKSAGAVILGKTRTTEFAFGTYNPSHPTPRNPCDRAVHRMPGGSSSGSAVAMAAGLCAIAFGTDTGGSVRQPAALCGVAGFKPTAGRLPMNGVFPLSPTFDSPGWFAPRIADIAVVWGVLSGEPTKRARPLNTIVVGRPDAHFFDDLDDDVARAFDAAQQRLIDAGVRIVPVTLPPLGDVDIAFGAFISAELVATLGRERVTTNLSQMDPVVAARITPGLELAADAYVALRARFAMLARDAHNAIGGVDVLVTPTCPHTAVPVAGHADPTVAAAWTRKTLRFTRPGNLFGLCGVSLPIGHLVGTRPVGLQLLARGGDDAALISTAAAIEMLLSRQSQ